MDTPSTTPDVPVRDFLGQQFGFDKHPTLGGWTVIEYLGKGRSVSRLGTSVFDLWKCRCRCGTVADIPAFNLRRNLSAGCATCGYKKSAETHQQPPKKHGRQWDNHKADMCPEWQDYAVFEAWREKQPVGNMYRRDTSLPHSPTNTLVSQHPPHADAMRERTAQIRMRATGETHEQAMAWVNSVSRQRQQQYRAKYANATPQPSGGHKRLCSHGLLRVSCSTCKTARREKNREYQRRRALAQRGLPPNTPLSKRCRPRLSPTGQQEPRT